MIPFIIAVGLGIASGVAAAYITWRASTRPDRFFDRAYCNPGGIVCSGVGPVEPGDQFTVAANGQLINVRVTDTMTVPGGVVEWTAIDMDQWNARYKIEDNP
jgi:hypothetical protein